MEQGRNGGTGARAIEDSCQSLQGDSLQLGNSANFLEVSNYGHSTQHPHYVQVFHVDASGTLCPEGIDAPILQIRILSPK